MVVQLLGGYTLTTTTITVVMDTHRVITIITQINGASANTVIVVVTTACTELIEALLEIIVGEVVKMDYRNKLELLGFKHNALYLGQRDSDGVPCAITEIWCSPDQSLQIVNRSTRIIHADELFPAHYQTLWTLCQHKEAICSTVNLDAMLTALGRVLIDESRASNKPDTNVVFNRRVSYV